MENIHDFLDHRQLAKLQWLQDQNQSNVGNPNNVRREASRRSRNKRKEYLKAKRDELKTNSKTKHRDLYRGISDFKSVYQSRTNIVRDGRVNCLQISTVFWLGGGTNSHSCSVYSTWGW
jgi:hypothetical protein